MQQLRPLASPARGWPGSQAASQGPTGRAPCSRLEALTPRGALRGLQGLRDLLQLLALNSAYVVTGNLAASYAAAVVNQLVISGLQRYAQERLRKVGGAPKPAPAPWCRPRSSQALGAPGPAGRCCLPLLGVLAVKGRRLCAGRRCALVASISAARRRLAAQHALLPDCPQRSEAISERLEQLNTQLRDIAAKKAAKEAQQAAGSAAADAASAAVAAPEPPAAAADSAAAAAGADEAAGAPPVVQSVSLADAYEQSLKQQQEQRLAKQAAASSNSSSSAHAAADDTAVALEAAAEEPVVPAVPADGLQRTIASLDQLLGELAVPTSGGSGAK